MDPSWRDKGGSVKPGMHSLLYLCVLVLSCGSAVQSQTQHPSEPTVNLGDTSFLDGVAGPGLMVEEIGDASSSHPVNAISGLTHIAWLSNKRVLGAWYGAEVVGALAHVNAGALGATGGIGDLTVSPVILQWKDRNVGSFSIAQRVVLDFDLPVGAYDRKANVNLSSHAFTVHPYYAVTLFPTKRLETSWRVHYLWNGTNHAPPFASGAKSTQAGQAVHFNATVAYTLSHGFSAGANGYFFKQVTAPKMNGASVPNSPEQVGAIGPGVVWDQGPCLFYLNVYHEVGAVNRPEGNKIVLRVQWIPGRKAREYAAPLTTPLEGKGNEWRAR